MSSKIQVKKKKARSRQKGTQIEDEIVEIEEIPSRRTSKKYPKKKENTENSSSEATTPNKKNKKKQNKKEKTLELIEIMDGDIQEEETLSLNNKKASPSVAKLKKSINKNVASNDKEKTISVKSVNKIKEKSPIIKGKKNQKKISSITLDESENGNESEIKVTTEVKLSSKIQKKGTSKTPKKKSINTTKDIMNDPEKKNKTNDKKNGKKNEINEEVMQCELSSESETENIKEVNLNSRQNKRKNNNKNKRNNKFQSDDYNSGYFSSRKTTQKKKIINENNENILKSRSTIKLSLRDNSMKSKANNFLGRKRKADPKSEESEAVKVKYPKSSSQIKAGKQKSKTPLKNNPKKNNKNNHDLSMSKMDIEEQNGDKKYAIPELALLNQLITEYGFEKVLDSFCKATLNKKNKLDLCLQGLKNSCTNERLPFLLIKMLFSYFDDKYEVSVRKRSTSSVKNNHLNNSNESQNNNNSNLEYSVMDQCEEASPIEVNEEEGAQDIKDKNKKGKCLDNNNNKGVKIKKSDEKKGEKKMMSIGSHYNKGEDGKVYKYQISSLDGKGNALFKCYDDKCSGTGNYNIETKEFSITKEHNLTHAEHDYIINSEKDGDKVFKDLIDKDKSDAQVFKENGERIVKIY